MPLSRFESERGNRITLSRKDAIAELWRRNRQSSHLLRPYQRDAGPAADAQGQEVFLAVLRRIGKTTTAIVTADELARQGA